MFGLRDFFDRLVIEWEQLNYLCSDERLELAQARLAMHKLHCEGKVKYSPYLNPDARWQDQRPN